MGSTLRDFGADAGTADAADALQRLEATYRELQLLAGRIISVYKERNAIIPCAVRDRYNKAVKTYLQMGNDVIQQLVQRGYRPVQQLIDMQGNVLKSFTEPTPVRPTTFVVLDCPGATLAGRQLGVAPAVVALIVQGTVRIVIFLGAAIVGLSTLKTIILKLWPSTSEQLIQEQKAWLERYLACVESKLPPEQCRDVAGLQPVKGRSIPEMIGVAVIIAGAAFGLYQLVKRYRANFGDDGALALAAWDIASMARRSR